MSSVEKSGCWIGSATTRWSVGACRGAGEPQGVRSFRFARNAIHVLAESGFVGVFRRFQNMRLGIDAVGAAGGIVEAAVCYTGDISDTSR